MKRYLWAICLVIWLISGSPSPAPAQTERDPLSEAEVDQMREAADYPNKRLELMVRFTRNGSP